MRNKNIRHLEVTEKDAMVGILPIKDFANYYHNKFYNETEEKGERRFFRIRFNHGCHRRRTPLRYHPPVRHLGPSTYYHGL